MNIFGLDIGDLDRRSVAEALDQRNLSYDLLPGVPIIMTRPECAAVADVSLPTIDRMISDGTLTETTIDGDTGILRSDFIALVENSLLCNRPVLDPEEGE